MGLAQHSPARLGRPFGCKGCFMGALQGLKGQLVTGADRGRPDAHRLVLLRTDGRSLKNPSCPGSFNFNHTPPIPSIPSLSLPPCVSTHNKPPISAPSEGKRNAYRGRKGQLVSFSQLNHSVHSNPSRVADHIFLSNSSNLVQSRAIARPNVSCRFVSLPKLSRLIACPGRPRQPRILPQSPKTS